MAAAILDFQISQLLLHDRVHRSEPHHHAIFVKISQSVAEILRFFVFFKMAAVRHLGWFMTYLDNPRRVLGGLYHCAKFGYNRCSSFDDMNVSILGAFGWKTSIHGPKIRVLGLFDP